MTETVSDDYLLGISEGRTFLRAWPEYNRGEAMTVDDMRQCEAACSANMARGFSGAMREVFRGERDFWRNQIRKHK